MVEYTKRNENVTLLSTSAKPNQIKSTQQPSALTQFFTKHEPNVKYFHRLHFNPLQYLHLKYRTGYIPLNRIQVN